MREPARAPLPLALAAFAFWAAAAQAVCPAPLQYSADVPVLLAGAYGDDHDYFLDNGGAPTRVFIAGIPERADLDALQIDANGDLLYSLDVGARLSGTYFDRADVIKLSSGATTLAFDASAASVPAGVNLDAAGRLGQNLVVSFDRGFKLGNTYIRPADVVEFNGTVLVGKVLDATARGLDDRLDVDAVHVVDSDTLLLSFERAGLVAGIAFGDQDVLQLVRSSGAWSKPCAFLERSDRWARANLDALSATPSPNAIFQDGFE